MRVYKVDGIFELNMETHLNNVSTSQLSQHNYRERRVERLLIPRCPELQLFVQHRDSRQRQSVVQG